MFNTKSTNILFTKKNKWIKLISLENKEKYEKSNISIV